MPRGQAQVRITVTGDTDKLRKIGLHCKGLAAENGAVIRKEMRTELRKAAKPTIMMQRRAVRGISGAPTEWKKTASRRVNLETRLTTKKAGIAIRVARGKKGDGPTNARYLNRGKWRRPRRGHREDRDWIEQRVTAGWFDRPARANEHKFYEAGVAVIDKIIKTFKIT